MREGYYKEYLLNTKGYKGCMARTKLENIRIFSSDTSEH